jgi:invasion protein IalB
MRLDRRITAACIAGLLVCSASAAFAQAASPAQPAAPSQVQQQPAAPAAGTQPAPATSGAGVVQAPPSPKVPDAVKAWAKFCDPAADGHKICIVRKLVFDNTNIIASVTLRIDSAKGVPTLAVAAVPVGVVLRPGLLWQIDKQKPVVLPFWRCTPQTCESEQLVKADFIGKLKQAKNLTLTAKNVAGKDFVVNVPLDGFGPIYDQKDAPTFAEYSKTLAAAR